MYSGVHMYGLGCTSRLGYEAILLHTHMIVVFLKAFIGIAPLKLDILQFEKYII